MKQPKARPGKGFTKYHIGPDDLVTVAGHKMRFSKEFENGVVLRSANDNGGRIKAYRWDEISTLLMAGRLEIEPGHLREQDEIARAMNDARGFELDPEKVLRVKMVAAFLAQEDDGADWESERCHRSDDDIERFYAIFKEENEDLVEEARVSMLKKGKKKLFVGPRQFRRLIERFEESALNPGSMADRYPGGGSPGSTLAVADLNYVLGFVQTARTPDRPTVISAWQAMMDDARARVAKGEARPRTVSLTTFQRMYSESNDFLNDVGHADAKHGVERKYVPKQKGLQVTRALEIVEMDEHKVHLMKMLVKNRVWDHLHPEVQTRIEGLGRVWLSVAMDALSRSIVGMKILKGAPDADAAVATLAMVAQRKEKLSALLGASSRWPQCGTPGAVHTDAGAGYVSAKFELAVMMFTGRHRIPPSKHPHLRGRIERFFRTLNQRYIHLFSGQTFSNPLLKGEYEPEKYAHVTDEEFADLIARLIIDCYHNTKHRALGMTPLEAWERATQLGSGGVRPPPSARKYREIFGSTVRRSIGNSGIVIAGNIYSNKKLLEIRKKWFRAKLWVRINEEDISMISVKHRRRNAWIDVPAVNEGLKGVTLDEWKETIRYIDRKLGTKKVHSEEVVANALKAAKEIIALSKQRPGVLVHDSLEKKLADLEASIPATFRYNQRHEYDYAQYDDGIDHEDEEDDDTEADAAERLKSGLEKAANLERYVQPISAGGNAFNPGAGVKAFDRSQFASDEAVETPRPSKAARVPSAVKSKAGNGKGASGSAAAAPVDACVVTPIANKAKKGIRITSAKTGDRR